MNHHSGEGPVRSCFLVKGMVQGVGFRMAACREARRLGLAGWVRNVSGGHVEVLVEGTVHDVGLFRAWCRRGPEQAVVRDIDEVRGTATGEFRAFDVRF